MTRTSTCDSVFPPHVGDARLTPGQALSGAPVHFVQYSSNLTIRVTVPLFPSTERASSCHIGRSATVRKAGHVPGGSPPPIHHFPSAARWIAAFAGFLQTLP